MTSGSRTAARYIINLTNPSVIGPVLVLVVFFTRVQNSQVLLEGAIALFLFLIFIPLIYVFFRMRAVHSKGDPTLYLKQHPGDILVLEIICGIPCWLVLTLLVKAPALCTDTLAALLVTALIVALINFFYRASFHLAAFTVIVYIIALTWGQLFLLIAFIIPAITWAKYHLREHTVLQMLLATTLGIIIAFLINFRF